MRLAMVSQDFAPTTGGIQTYTLEVAKRLAPRAESFVLVVPRHAQSTHDELLGFRVQRLAGGSDALPLTCAPYLTHLVRRGQVDTLLHVQWQTAPVGMMLRRFGRLDKLAVVVHGRELVLAPFARVAGAQRLYDELRTRVLQSSDVILPVSRYSGQLAVEQGAPSTRVSVVPNGVDAARFTGADGASFRAMHALGDARVLLTLGRLVPRKGVDTVIQCLPALLTRVPDLLYVVAGDGPDRARLQELARACSVADRVRFVGRVDERELAACYAACDAFVLAARDDRDSVEGFGLVLLEAAACGRAVVATRAGGIEDAVRDGQTGLLVARAGAEPLIEALARVLTDHELRARLAAGGRQHATQEATWERAAEQIYDALTR